MITPTSVPRYPITDKLRIMKKRISKMDNYFERNRIIRNAQNYRYNFIDYLYYQGERYKKIPRCDGWYMVTWYWIGFGFFPILIFFFPEIILICNKLMLWIHPLIVTFAVPVLLLALPPTLWCKFRYSEERMAAIKHHYRKSTWAHSFPLWFIIFIPLLPMGFTIYFVLRNGYSQ